MGRAVVIIALLEVAPAVAFGQASTSTSTPTPTPTPTPDKPVVPATGYGWSDPKKPARATTAGRISHRKSDAPEATLPGFETLADGSSRLFVELTKPVKYETKTGKGTITYVLKGAYVGRRNNYNPLVTVHFNTPVSSARLVPHGSDLWFVVSLRASAQPTVAFDATKDGGSMLRVEFPKGNYLPATRSTETAPARSDDTTDGH